MSINKQVSIGTTNPNDESNVEKKNGNNNRNVICRHGDFKKPDVSRVNQKLSMTFDKGCAVSIRQH